MKIINTKNNTGASNLKEGKKPSPTLYSIAVTFLVTLATLAMIAASGFSAGSNLRAVNEPSGGHVQRMMQEGGMSPGFIEDIVNSDPGYDPDPWDEIVDIVNSNYPVEEGPPTNWSLVMKNVVDFLRLFMRSK